MRWPYHKRIDPMVAFAVATIGIALATYLVTARPLNPHPPRIWWWPTNWMTGPLIIFLAGLVLLIVPLRRPQPETPSQQTPPSTTLNRVTVTRNAQLTIDSSAERLANGTQITDNARVSARHFPGHPDILASSTKAPYGQESQAQTEQGPTRARRPDGDPRP